MKEKTSMLCTRRAASRIIIAVMLGASFPVGSAAAQTVDEVVATTLAARGGVEKLRSLQTVKSTVRMTDGRGREMTVTSWTKRPNKMRRDTQLPDRTLTVATDGTSVWMMDSAAGVSQPVHGPQAEMTREQAVFDPPFLDYKARGDQVELVGMSNIDGTEAYHLRLIRKNGRVENHYVSAEDGRSLRTVETFEQGGMKEEIRTDFSDYQTVDGMLIPHTIAQSMSGKPVVRVKVEKLEFNVPIEDQFFEMAGKS
jgi:outer membrane lipoprotein-sorting protein